MSGKNIISKSLLQDFIKQEKLSGTVSFLYFIKQKKHLRDFYDFCKRHSFMLTGKPPENVLFHGSQKPQSFLKPNTSIGRSGKAERKAYVYATDDPNYAIFLAVLKLKNGSASVNAKSKNTTLMINLDFVNGPSKLKNGYVHVVEDKSFKRTTNSEYKTDKIVRVSFSIPIMPQNLTVPIHLQAKA